MINQLYLYVKQKIIADKICFLLKVMYHSGMNTCRFFLTILFLSLFSLVRGQNTDTPLYKTPVSIDPIKAEKANALVLSYIRIILKGDRLDSLVHFCAIPFAWDRKKIIENWADFNAAQQSVIDRKGKNRQFIIDTVYIESVKSEMLDKIIPLNIYYVIAKIKVPGDTRGRIRSISFAVQISENPKIVGFSD